MGGGGGRGGGGGACWIAARLGAFFFRLRGYFILRKDVAVGGSGGGGGGGGVGGDGSDSGGGGGGRSACQSARELSVRKQASHQALQQGRLQETQRAAAPEAWVMCKHDSQQAVPPIFAFWAKGRQEALHHPLHCDRIQETQEAQRTAGAETRVKRLHHSQQPLPPILLLPKRADTQQETCEGNVCWLVKVHIVALARCSPHKALVKGPVGGDKTPVKMIRVRPVTVTVHVSLHKDCGMQEVHSDTLGTEHRCKLDHITAFAPRQSESLVWLYWQIDLAMQRAAARNCSIL
jgi:hypothetical protein